jgi:hypothetical protein
VAGLILQFFRYSNHILQPVTLKPML